jgi:hypothetical protein
VYITKYQNNRENSAIMKAASFDLKDDMNVIGKIKNKNPMAIWKKDLSFSSE